MPELRASIGANFTLAALTRSLWALYTNGDATLAPPGYGRSSETRPSTSPPLDAAQITELWPQHVLPLDRPLTWSPP